VVGVTFMIWVRWTLPRLRIDQVMQVCLKYCVPIAAVMFLGATAWTYLLPGGLGLRSMPYGMRYDTTNVQPAAASASAPAQSQHQALDVKPRKVALSDAPGLERN